MFKEDINSQTLIQKKEKIYIVVALIILALYLLPYLVLGQNSHILIFDNLDSRIAQIKFLANSGLVFGPLDSIVPNFLNGVPRNVLGPDLDFMLLLYFIFPPYIAYVVNLTLMHFTAFFGMYLLLKYHFLKENQHLIIIIGSALCFSLLPFWPPGGLTIAGLPLVLYAFLNIRSGNYKLKNWLILLLVPFYSSFILSYVFLLFLLFGLWIYDYIKTKRSNYRFLISIIFMTIIFLIIEYRLIYTFFIDQNYISQRTEWVLGYHDLKSSLKIALNNFIFGQYHASSLQQYFVGITVLISVILMIKNKFEKKLTSILILAFLISLLYGFYRVNLLKPFQDELNFLNNFNLTRFHWLHPLLWYIIFALALGIILKYMKFGKYLILILLIFQIAFLFYNNSEFVERRNGNPTYKQFYSVNLFNEIKEAIGEDQKEYKVASIGIHPSIALYNGFYTIDGFWTNYPLEHKHKFRKIIEKELAKNDTIKDYFDDQADRCYIMTSEAGCNWMIDKNSSIVLNDLELNNKALKDFNCKYILSSIKINNNIENGLELMGIFEDEESIWRIYVYEVY